MEEGVHEWWWEKVTSECEEDSSARTNSGRPAFQLPCFPEEWDTREAVCSWHCHRQLKLQPQGLRLLAISALSGRPCCQKCIKEETVLGIAHFVSLHFTVLEPVHLLVGPEH
ncbi:hypothetical protein NDU88_007845 [Pleurodeles waltl]|uniref:Uncharacterized protein n=1 Tax=Pleurodeles waltl TaxID=8319 RepID=A0AAV7VQV2_PLEWA|nr:hypothetical protein NDU88_007845 [Pleurodeles waltl]